MNNPIDELDESILRIEFVNFVSKFSDEEIEYLKNDGIFKMYKIFSMANRRHNSGKK